MTIFETVGLAWIILTSTLATVAIFYCAWVGLIHVLLKRTPDTSDRARIPGVLAE